MDLKYKEVTHYVVDYHDFEAWVEANFGQTFEFAPAEECGNDTDHSYHVTGTHFDLETKTQVPGMDEYDRKRVTEFEEGGSAMYLSSALLEAGVERELIPAGQYLIRVSW